MGYLHVEGGVVYLTSFGHLLKAYRQAHNLTQADLARRVHCAVVTIKKLEGDRLTPSRQLATLLAGVFDLSADDRATFLRTARPESVACTVPGRAGAATLPIPATPLIGRRREIRHVVALLRQPTVRLLTLTGVGGVGKTRIALQVAQELHAAFGDGVTFVSLAAVQDAALVAGALAATLGITETAGQPVTTALQHYLHDKHLLLVLDNCEQVLAAGTLVATLLGTCAGLKVLATSRAVLQLAGERVVRTPALTLPATTHPLRTREARRSEAVQLFVARACALDDTVTLTDANATVIGAICRRVAGLPLAIELAAARTTVLALPALHERLTDPLLLLANGSRDAPARHHTMRATIDWSYALLAEREQQLLAHLAVFAGGWTLEAATALCDSEPGLAGQVVDRLATLVDHNLVQQQTLAAIDEVGAAPAPGEVRFALLEPIRQYALERLQARGAAEQVRACHAAYYGAVVRCAEPALRSTAQHAWLERLEREHDNLRAALAWSLRADPTLGLQLAGHLAPFWGLRGYWTEGRRWLAMALERATLDADGAATARALTGDGMLAWCQGDLGVAKQQLTRALPRWRAVDDTRGIATTLEILATVQPLEVARSQAQLAECLALYRKHDDQWGMAFVLASLGDVLRWFGDHQAAGPLLEESLAIARREGYAQLCAMALLLLGRLAQDRGELAAARRWFAESVTVCRATRDQFNMLPALGGWAAVEVALGDHPVAQRTVRECLQLSRKLGDRFWEAAMLSELGALAEAQGERAAAAAQYQASLRVWHLVGAPVFTVATLHRLGRLAQTNGDGAQATAWYDEAVAVARRSGDGALMATADQEQATRAQQPGVTDDAQVAGAARPE